MKTFKIALTNGGHAIVDSEDLPKLLGIKWRNFNGYAIAKASKKTKHLLHGRSRAYLHAAIMEPHAGMVVDHIDGDGLNCSKSNMRVCTMSQNSMNRRRNKKKYKDLPKGVYESGSNYRAMIKTKGKLLHIGNYGSPEEASHAYDNAAVKYFGEFARPNNV